MNRPRWRGDTEKTEFGISFLGKQLRLDHEFAKKLCSVSPSLGRELFFDCGSAS